MAKKKKVVKKPQPLPRSVKALLGYLGGSDVKIGGSGPQRAIVAPQSLLGAPQPQQQPSQITPREKPIGTRIAESPLARLALRPQLPSVTQIVKVKIPSSVPVIETPRQSAVIKPKIEEPKLQVDISQPKITQFFTKEVRKQAEVEAGSAGELKAREVVSSKPEMTQAVKLRGRPGPKPKTAEQKQQAQEARALERAIRARREEGFASGSEVELRVDKPKKTRGRPKILQGVDPATQISAMAGQAAAPEQRGQSLEQLSGEK